LSQTLHMPPFEISPAAAHELLPACRLLFADGRAEHSRDLLLSDSQRSGLFVARDSTGRLHAAALVQVLPGALGVAWPVRGDSAETQDAVTRAACEWLRSRGVKVCQAFVAASEKADMTPLERYGFRHTTQLVSLRRAVADEALLPPVPEPALEWIDEGLPLSAEFRQALLATQEGTLDCPELTGARTTEEVLAGFEVPAPGALSLYRAGSEPVGVVLCAEVDSETIEITYLGVVPEHRRRGVGAQMLAGNLWGACYGGYKAVTLSVDARNTPAMKLYARHGFVEDERREVWIAAWPA
jgi:mycothiol synthase